MMLVLSAKSLPAQEVVDGPQTPVVVADMSIEKAIDLVLKNNLTISSAGYGMAMTDTEYRLFIKKYSPEAALEGGYTNQDSPPTSMSIFTGTTQKQWDAAASLSKLFSSGTTVSLGVKEVYYDANDMAFPLLGKNTTDPAYHKPSLFINVQQELLKNAFGYTDRMQEKILKNGIEMQRNVIVNQLSALVAGALVDYWAVAVRKSAVDNARLELESNRQVRAIIAQNVGIGMAESYDLNQYNALVASAETMLEMAEQEYRDAVRKFLRIVNLPPDSKLEGMTKLSDELPALDVEESLAAGFAKRVDYRNARTELENLEMDMRVQENGTLPSLTLSLGGNTLSQDTVYLDALNQNYTAEYPGWNVRLKATYTFDDTAQKTLARNAFMKKQQAELAVKNLRLEVRDDVLSKLDRVRMMHQVLLKTRNIRLESEMYYRKILVRFRQGKVSSVAMKNALDAMVQSRQRELEVLVGYNVALLELDLAKNEMFERYNVDIGKYLSMKKK